MRGGVGSDYVIITNLAKNHVHFFSFGGHGGPVGLAGLSSGAPSPLKKKFRLPIASDDFELSDEWKAELDRREEALDKGASVGKPAKDVIAKYINQGIKGVGR
jgi:hypothetical protein